MHDFPPVVPDFDSHPLPEAPGRGASSRTRRIPARDFSRPDTRSPSRFVGWILWQQAGLLVLVSLLATLAFLPGSIGPYLVGRIIDEGITTGDLGRVGRLTAILGAVVVTSIICGILQHTFIVRAWLVAMYGVMKLVTRKTTQMGHVQNRRTPAGEVLSVSSGDSDQFGALSEVITRAVGALVAYLVIAAIVLATSVQLGIAVLVAAPVLVLSTLPALKPLHRRQEAERTRSSELTSLATDIVAGLRILRGIGGERTFAQNYAEQSQRTRKAGVAAGNWQAGLDGLGILLSGLFLVILTWLGARQVAVGILTVGQLVSFFGYAIFVVWPIRTFFELAQKWVRCLVSARKTIIVLGAEPPWISPDERTLLPVGAPLADAQSGFVAAPGQLTVVVSALPDDSSALADRLGRFLPTDRDPISLDLEEGVKGRAARTARAKQRQARQQLLDRDREMAERRWGVTVGVVDLATVDIAVVRQHILVSDTAAQVFAGTLQSALDPHGRLSRAEAEDALRTASAEDVFDSLPGGWQGRIDERGRGLSGGQRQRVVLARALAADPEILVLVEPTSAVDAHTEAIIAGRLTQHRRGRTTIVMTVSPLLLHHADEVAFMSEGRIVAVGPHDHLLRTHDGYRRVVARTMEDSDA